MNDSADNASAISIVVVLLFIVGLAVLNWWQYYGQYSDPVVRTGDRLQFTSGTEYSPGQDGQVAVIVYDATGAPVTDEFQCSYTILYPNKTTFLSGQMLANTSIGTQYVTFTVPDTAGVYEYASTCVYDSADVIVFFGNSTDVRPDANLTAAKSFHVSVAAQVNTLRAVITQ